MPSLLYSHPELGFLLSWLTSMSPGMGVWLFGEFIPVCWEGVALPDSSSNMIKASAEASHPATSELVKILPGNLSSLWSELLWLETLWKGGPVGSDVNIYQRCNQKHLNHIFNQKYLNHIFNPKKLYHTFNQKHLNHSLDQKYLNHISTQNIYITLSTKKNGKCNTNRSTLTSYLLLM